MGLLLKQLFGFLKLLNSDTGTNQIAAGFACGFILGMTPAFSLQTLLVIILVFFFRIQLGAVFIAAFFFAFVAFLLDPVFHLVGVQVLEMEALRPLFTSLFNMPIVPFTRFYNTIVMGSAVVSLILALPVFFLSKYLVVKYRATVYARFQESRFFKAVKATSIYQWYYKYNQLYG